VVERLARAWGIPLVRRGEAETGAGVAEGVPVLLVRPLTYMNRSGEAVAPLARARGCSPEELVVVHDDLDLPAGGVRLKRGGGTGGHNGLRSLVETLGSAEFLRVRVGIGRPPPGADPADYVLSPPPPEVGDAFEAGVADAAAAVGDLLREGFERAATRWNARRRPASSRGADSSPRPGAGAGGEGDQPKGGTRTRR